MNTFTSKLWRIWLPDSFYLSVVLATLISVILTSKASSGESGSCNSLTAADGSPAIAVFVDDLGRVGIGTITPQGELDISTSGLDNPQLNLSNNQESPADIVYRQSGTVKALLRIHHDGQGATWDFQDREGSAVTSQLFLSGDNRVGIGTTNPASKLDVTGGLAINGMEVINSLGQWLGDPTGLEKPQGPQGPQGPAGPQGPPGPSAELTVFWSSGGQCSSVCSSQGGVSAADSSGNICKDISGRLGRGVCWQSICSSLNNGKCGYHCVSGGGCTDDASTVQAQCRCVYIN